MTKEYNSWLDREEELEPDVPYNNVAPLFGRPTVSLNKPAPRISWFSRLRYAIAWWVMP